MDETGLPWTLRGEAADPSKIVAGAYVMAGCGTAVAVAEVVGLGEDGVVHLRQLPGLIGEHAHLVRTSA